MIREIKSHNIIKLTTYLQQSLNYQGPSKLMISQFPDFKAEGLLSAMYPKQRVTWNY